MIFGCNWFPQLLFACAVFVGNILHFDYIQSLRITIFILTNVYLFIILIFILSSEMMFLQMFVAAIRDPAGVIMNYVGVQVEVKTEKLQMKFN